MNETLLYGVIGALFTVGCALVGVVYANLSSQIGDVKTEVGKLREARHQTANTLTAHELRLDRLNGGH